MADYTIVTELPGYKAPREQRERLLQRYHFAAQFCTDKDILEVACGGGQGLGYLAHTANRVVGTDIDENNLQFARDNYNQRENITVTPMDAEKLEFDDQKFDVVILYEAIYYLV